MADRVFDRPSKIREKTRTEHSPKCPFHALTSPFNRVHKLWRNPFRSYSDREISRGTTNGLVPFYRVVDQEMVTEALLESYRHPVSADGETMESLLRPHLFEDLSPQWLKKKSLADSVLPLGSVRFWDQVFKAANAYDPSVLPQASEAFKKYQSAGSKEAFMERFSSIMMAGFVKPVTISLLIAAVGSEFPIEHYYAAEVEEDKLKKRSNRFPALAAIQNLYPTPAENYDELFERFQRLLPAEGQKTQADLYDLFEKHNTFFTELIINDDGSLRQPEHMSRCSGVRVVKMCLNAVGTKFAEPGFKEELRPLLVK